jgi:hypothetical protein
MQRGEVVPVCRIDIVAPFNQGSYKFGITGSSCMVHRCTAVSICVHAAHYLGASNR